MGSQQHQAETLNDQGNQAVEEIRRVENENYTKFLAGNMTGEEYRSAGEDLKDKLETHKAYFDRAAELSTLTAQSVSLSDAVRSPPARRPWDQVDKGAPVTDHLGSEGLDARFDRVSLALESFLSNQGSYDLNRGPVLRMGSRERALVNKMFRPANESIPGSDIRLSLTKEEMQFLHAPRTDKMMNPYVDSDGGWIVAEEVMNEVVTLRELSTGIVSRFRTIGIGGGRLTFPTSNLRFNFEKRDRTGAFKITPERLVEVWGKGEFIPSGRDKIITVPEQLIEDATTDVISFVAEEARRISDEEDELLGIQGSGNSEPLGYLNGMTRLYDSLDVADRNGQNIGIDPGQNNIPAFAGSAINPEFIQLFHTFVLPATARGNAVWTGPPEFERAVMIQREQPGGDNTGAFMWRPAAFAGAPTTLNQKPLLISQFFPNNWDSGSEGDPLFHYGDLRDMWWVVRTGLGFRVLNELYQETSEIGIKWRKRQDGGLVRPDGNIYARRQA